jgi:hypothetical protein
VPITTKVVSLNPAQGRVSTIHYMIKIATGRWFSPGSPVSSTNKTDCHNITEILLKVVLSVKHNKGNSNPTSFPCFENMKLNFKGHTILV